MPDRSRTPGRTPGARPEASWSRWVIWAIGLVIVALLAMSLLMPTSDRADLSYPDFMQRVSSGEVTKIRINNDTSKVTGDLKYGKLF